jgi:hypothetical protein
LLGQNDGYFRLKACIPAIGKGNPPGTDHGAYGTGALAPAAAEATVEKSAAAPAPAAAATEAAKAESAAPKEAAETELPTPVPDDAPKETAKTETTGGVNDVSAKQAFDDAKALGTVEAWNAFLKNYPDGFYADLARAYLAKLEGAEPAAPAPENPEAEAPVPDAPATDTEAPATDTAVPAPVVETGEGTAKRPAPAVARGGDFMGFPEQFNRYYTYPSWKPSKIVYVSPAGGGDGATRETPMAVKDAVAAATPGTQIQFLSGKYQGGHEFSKETSGTYDDPIVLLAERNKDKSIGVSMDCAVGKRKVCFNLENADYIGIDGFEFVGGNFGVRAVGEDYVASNHSRGIAVLNSDGHDQERDPFFSGQSDWDVWEGNLAHGAKKGDGHGIYLSNGGDWNIVRFNQTFGNSSSDFQINADPASTCAEPGIPFDDPRCDAYAGEGEGGQGASDYFLVDGNYFHGSDVGPNFTSVRRSIVRNNIFGPQVRHNASFWQETDNPKLGSSGNKILNNLFITGNNRHAVQFSINSTGNEFANNVILGVKIEGGNVTANPAALLMEVDDTVAENVYRDNLYVSGTMEGREPNGEETALDDFSPSWFRKFPTGAAHNDPNDFTPTAEAPFLGTGSLSPDAPVDRNGTLRADPADLGPIERP